MKAGWYVASRPISASLVLALLAVFVTPIGNAAPWTAHVIRVRGPDQTRFVLGDQHGGGGRAWDFMGGTAGARTTGLRTIRETANHLAFTSTVTTALDWGEVGRGTSSGQQVLIGAGWKLSRVPWVVRMKIRQSLPSSTWYIQARFDQHGHPRILRKKATLHGKGEQVLSFDMGPCRHTFYGLRIGTRTPGNRVAIDWVRVERPSALRYFSYTFSLSSRPLLGKFVFGINAPYKMYINGQLVSADGGDGVFDRSLNRVTVRDALRAGRNRLIVVADQYGASTRLRGRPNDYFFLQGNVFTADGREVPIRTDREWRAAYWPHRSWLKRDYNDSRLPFASDVGTLKANELDGKSVNGRGDFFGAPYLGRLTLRPVGATYPIFRAGKGVSLNVDAIAAHPGSSAALRYTVQSASSSVVLSGEIRLRPTAEVWKLHGLLRLNPLPPGPYELHLRYVDSSGPAIDSRTYGFAVVGQIKQPPLADGDGAALGLHLEDSVRFDAGSPSRQILCGRGRTHGARALLSDLLRPLNDVGLSSGRYLETGWGRGDWCSFQIHVQHLYQPHVVQVTYPDNADRHMVFLLAEGTRYRHLQNIGAGGGIPRAAPGVITGGRFPSPGGTKTLRFVYWPNKKKATFTLVNLSRTIASPAAVAGVNIYDVTRPLPTAASLGTASPMIGPFVERVDRSTPQAFYAGRLGAKFAHGLQGANFPGYYRAWYATISNLIQYLRFTGQNTYFAGIYMYYGGWFSSPQFQGWPESGVNRYGAGWNNPAIALMARMFEANGLNLVLGVQFIGDRTLLEGDRVTNAEVRDGAATTRFVMADGRQARGFQNSGYNFLATRVRKEMIDLADLISKRYSKFPAIKGVLWAREPEFPLPGNARTDATPLDVGYGDLTVRQFEVDTGILVPVSSSDPRRFEKRYEWLTTHHRSAWINWRCRKVKQLLNELSTHIRQRRRDWRFWYMQPNIAPSAVRLWAKGRISYRDVYMYSGIDPAMFHGTHGPRLIPLVGLNRAMGVVSSRLKAQESDDFSKFNRDKSRIGLIDSAGVFLRTRFVFEGKLETHQPWAWKHVKVVGYALPGGQMLTSMLHHAVGRAKPPVVILTWSDSGEYVGQEGPIREFARSLLH